MPDTPRHVLALWAVGLAVVALLGVRYLTRGGDPPAPSAPAIQVGDSAGGASSSARVVVDVAGAVRRPGVYRLPARSRVVDAVHRAGGARHGADLSALNLAAKLEDGRQVIVPLRAATAAAASDSGAAAAAPGAAAPAAPVDLNTATPEQLDQLDGIGPGMAGRILDYRKEHGGFGSVEELSQVPGIGEKRLAALREKVRV
jgi:competence protein ComEA